MISGKFDLETEAAVINFQKANNLQVDGVVGPLSWACLFYPRLYRNQKSMSPKLQDAVKELQTILNQEGFFKKEPDGYFSRETSLGVFTNKTVKGVKLTAFTIRSLCVNWYFLETNYQFIGDIV